jgi:hypothetical protein
MQAAGAGEDQAVGAGLAGEVGDEFRGAMEIVDQGGAAEAGEEAGRILAGAGTEGGIVEGEIGVGGELAAEEGGLAGAAWTLHEDGRGLLRRAVKGDGEGPLKHAK